MRKTSKISTRLFCRAFSLVEVAIAMGIISFAMVGLLGTLPLGIIAFRQAMGNTVESEIVQNLSNDISLANTSDLSSYSNQVFYYDYQGSQLPVFTTGMAPTNTVYEATVYIGSVSSTNSPVAFNSTSSASTVMVAISNLSDQSVYTLQHPHQYSVIIANNGL